MLKVQYATKLNKIVQFCVNLALTFFFRVRQFPFIEDGFITFLTPDPWDCKRFPLDTFSVYTGSVEDRFHLQVH